MFFFNRKKRYQLPPFHFSLSVLTVLWSWHVKTWPWLCHGFFSFVFHTIILHNVWPKAWVHSRRIVSALLSGHVTFDSCNSSRKQIPGKGFLSECVEIRSQAFVSAECLPRCPISYKPPFSQHTSASKKVKGIWWCLQQVYWRSRRVLGRPGRWYWLV